jgi:hypothetical protein
MDLAAASLASLLLSPLAYNKIGLKILTPLWIFPFYNAMPAQNDNLILISLPLEILFLTTRRFSTVRIKLIFREVPVIMLQVPEKYYT